MFLQALRIVAQAIFPSIQSSGNITINYYGDALNNKNYIIAQINNANNSSNNSPTIKEIEDQKDEIIPALIEDEIICLPLSTKPLILKFRPTILLIPTLTHNYKTVFIRNYKSKSLGTEMRKMLSQLGQTLIDLKLFDCEIDVMTLCDMLCELPLLQTLELSMNLTMDATIESKEQKIPKLLHLREFKMEINADMVEYMLDITSNASNLEFLTLFDANFDINEFNDHLKQYKCLKSLSLTNCVVSNANSFSNIKKLQFYHIDKLSTMNYTIFDCLKQLETLHLIGVNDLLLKMLKSKCTDGLQELTVHYTPEQNKYVTRLFIGWKENETNNYILDRNRNQMFAIVKKYYGMFKNTNEFELKHSN